jgi:hypothetical protein
MAPKFDTQSNPTENGQYSLSRNGNGSGGWIFRWQNSHTSHLSSSANKWRLKIGTAKYSWNIFPGPSNQFVVINDNGTNVNSDPDVRNLSTTYTFLWVCPEYQKPSETTWNSGQWTKFYPIA